MGKITSEDVRPILEKFQRLTGEKPNKITTADVSGPIRKKKNDDVPDKSITESEQEKAKGDVNESSTSKSPSQSALGVGKKIAKAFREEILSSGTSHSTSAVTYADKDVVIEEKEKPVDYSNFKIPPNTYAIAIDDSKIQRKLLAKIFDNAGISPDRCTICGDGYDEIMGFEDYVVRFLESHDGYVFMIGELRCEKSIIILFYSCLTLLFQSMRTWTSSMKLPRPLIQYRALSALKTFVSGCLTKWRGGCSH